MGFKVPRRRADFTFEGTDYDGLELTTQLDVPLEMVLEIQRLAAASQAAVVAEEAPDPDLQERMFKLFAGVIHKWNIEEDDSTTVVPVGFDGLKTLPQLLVTAMIQRWVTAMSEADAPLGKPSSDGGTSEGDTTKTETP